MLDTYADVERALGRYTDPLQPRTGSVTVVSGHRGNTTFPFPAALLGDLEERDELRRRMACLPRADVYVLIRWYVEGATPMAIARGLHCSRRQVYRRRRAAVAGVVALGGTDDFGDADASEFG
jgi:DNA-directed RNA polymerase specialized sigma24 family protein